MTSRRWGDPIGSLLTLFVLRDPTVWPHPFDVVQYAKSSYSIIMCIKFCFLFICTEKGCKDYHDCLLWRQSQTYSLSCKCTGSVQSNHEVSHLRDFLMFSGAKIWPKFSPSPNGNKVTFFPNFEKKNLFSHHTHHTSYMVTILLSYNFSFNLMAILYV